MEVGPMCKSVRALFRAEYGGIVSAGAALYQGEPDDIAQVRCFEENGVLEAS